MGAVGSCFDNAVAETFFATLTKELLLHQTPKGGWATRAELRSAIFEFIEGYYNPTRLHSTLGMRSPIDEADHAAGDPDGLARAGARGKAVHNLRLVRRETGMKKEMEELYVEGLAIHGGPESCVGDPRGRGEALTGVRAGWAMEPRNGQTGMPTPSTEAEGHVPGGATASRRGIPRNRKNPGTHGIFMHGNREVPRSPVGCR
jgi:hypothetical protein